MAAFLFSLKDVSDDEAEDVRAMLSANGIGFYETAGSNWGISSAAIWLEDDALLAQAKSLLDEYQRQRGARERERYRQLESEGKHRTFLRAWREEPVRITIYLAIIAAVLYFSIKPYLSLGE